MGNQTTGLQNGQNETHYKIVSDVCFRTSNYAPIDNSVRYQVFIKKTPNELSDDLENTSGYKMRELLSRNSPMMDVMDEKDFEHITTCELDPIGLVVVLSNDKFEASGNRAPSFNIVSTIFDNRRLQGETLVVGSQKLVLAANQCKSKDDLLETIAHETANGGRVVAAWRTDSKLNTSKQVDLLIKLPCQIREQYFAYQISTTIDPFSRYSITSSDDNDNSHRNTSQISDHMHKALEAGWTVVDVVHSMDPAMLIWLLERPVTDALINEPAYEGRILEIELFLDDISSSNYFKDDLIAKQFTDVLNNLGSIGWSLKSIINVPISSKKTVLLLLQRPVKKASSSTSQKTSDLFAPPEYIPNYFNSSGSMTAEDETEPPLYDDFISKK